MTLDELREQVTVELEAMALVVNELFSLEQDVLDREPTIREKTAGAAFVAQFYSGVENILKRISVFRGVDLPTGEMWHVDLFLGFARPPHTGLPELFDPELASVLAPYRRFRHVAFHSYGFDVDWQRMLEGVRNAPAVFALFRNRLIEYLNNPDN